MKDSSTSPTHGTRTLVAVFAVGMLMVLLVVVSIYHGNLISSRHAPLIDAAMEIKLEATTAHLWFEEILSGDRHESIDAVWAHLDQADWYAGAMLDGGHNQKGRFRPLEEPELRRQLTEVRGKLAQFQRITRERLAARLEAGAGTDIDQRYDTVFKDVMTQADRVATRLQADMAEELGQFHKLQAFLMVMIIAATLTAAALLYRGQGKWQRHVAELEAARASMRSSEGRLRSLIDSIPDLIWLKDPNGVYLACNATFERFFGAKEAQIVGKTDHDFVDKELADSFRANDRAAIQAGGPRHNEEWVTFADDGHRALLETTKTPIRTSIGALVGVLGVGHDITALRQKERTLNSIFRAAPIGIGLVIDRVFREVNDTFCTMTGYSREELLGERSRLIYPSDEEFERVGQVKYAQIRASGSGNVETRFRRKDGELIDVLLSSTLLDMQDSVAGATFTAMDITSQKKAERALRDSEQRYRGVVEDSPLLICGFLPGGEITFVNGAYSDYFATGPEQLVGTHFTSLIPDADREAVLANIAALSREQPTQTHEHRVGVPDGAVRWQRWTNRALFDWQGRVVSYQAIGEDVTERKLAEEALRYSETRYRELVESMSGGVAVYDAVDGGRDFVFRELNRAGETISRLPRDQVIGRRVTEVFPGISELGLLDVFQRVWRTGEAEDYPTHFYRDERVQQWVENHVFKLPTGEIVAIYDDVSREWQAETELKRQLDELRRWQEVTLGREGRVLELKQEINALLAELGRPERYLSAEAHAETAPLSPHTQPRDG